MNCLDARVDLLALNRGWLDLSAEEELRAHLEGCEACRRARVAEGLLDEILREKLPRPAPSDELLRTLARLAEDAGPAKPSPHPRDRRWQRLVAPALAAALSVAVVGLVVERRAASEDATRGALVAEAVSDHLRVLVSQHPLEIASGGTHEVKPWFEGRLEFAPVVPLPPVADLRLRGGAVGYFLDRKAALVGYSLRRHAVTLIAFRADGLGWPEARSTGRVQHLTARGFDVALWREGELGYALVSDLAAEEFALLASAFAAATGR